MARFRFALDSLLKLRERREEAARQELADNQRKALQAQAQVDALDEERAAVAGSVSRPGSPPPVRALQTGYARYHLLGERRIQAHEELQAAAQAHEQSREAAVTAQRELKTIQRLHDEALRRHLEYTRRREDQELDETASVRAARKGIESRP